MPIKKGDSMATVGRKPHEPTDEQRGKVKRLTGFGISECDVARFFEMSLPTLRKHYMHELETGHVEPNVKVAQSLFRLATDERHPSVTACIFWLKSRAGWCEEDMAGMGKKEMADVMARASDKTNSGWDKLLTPKAKATAD